MQKPKGSGMAPDGRPTLALITEDSFAAVIRAYLASPKFKGYAEATQDAWRRELTLASHPDCLGAISRQTIRPALVQAFLDGLDGRPGKQANALAAIKQLEKWATVRDLLPRPITTGVETESPDGGHVPWNAEQVALAESHAHADLARAVTLAANTGQRGSDLVRMGPTDIETFNGIAGINVTQKKTGRQVWVPITSTLAAAMETWDRKPGPFLRRPDGRTWTRKELTRAWTIERDTNPALASLKAAGLVLHGLRAYACVALLRSGANTRQISDMVGMSEPMVANYTRLSVQRENASAAVYNLERTIRERKERLG